MTTSIGCLGGADARCLYGTTAEPAAPRRAAACHPAAEPAPVAEPAAVADTRATLIYRRSERTALYIETQEGDTVRVRIKTREALTLDAAAVQGEDGGELLTELQLRARDTTKIAFYVDGDLSEAELTAIRAVIEQASALADEFFAGNLDAAFASAADLHIDASQLAKVGLRMSVREQLTYTQRGAALPVPAQTPAPPAPSTEASPTPAPAEPSATPAAPAASAADPNAAAPPSAPTGAPPDGETPPVPTAPSEPSVLAARVLEQIAAFLSHLLETFDEAGEPQDPETPSVHMSLKIKILHSVLLTVSTHATAPAADDHSTLPALVPETLDALAAAQQPPLHDVA